MPRMLSIRVIRTRLNICPGANRCPCMQTTCWVAATNLAVNLTLSFWRRSWEFTPSSYPRSCLSSSALRLCHQSQLILSTQSMELNPKRSRKNTANRGLSCYPTMNRSSRLRSLGHNLKRRSSPRSSQTSHSLLSNTNPRILWIRCLIR